MPSSHAQFMTYFATYVVILMYRRYGRKEKKLSRARQLVGLGLHGSFDSPSHNNIIGNLRLDPSCHTSLQSVLFSGQRLLFIPGTKLKRTG